MGAAKNVSESTFAEDVLNNDKPVIVDFWAAWCGPCRMVAPVLEEMAAEHADKIEVVKVDVDANPGLAAKYGITSIPAIHLFEKGEITKSVIGAMPKQAMEREFASVLGG